jgi:hypothetical protein
MVVKPSARRLQQTTRRILQSHSLFCLTQAAALHVPLRLLSLQSMSQQ